MPKTAALAAARFCWRTAAAPVSSNSRRLGGLVLGERPVPVSPDANGAKLLAEGVVNLGIDRLPWTGALKQWLDRVMFLRHSEGANWPDVSDAALAASAEQWLAPTLASKTAIAEMSADEFAAALGELLPWPLRRRLDAEAPIYFEAPTGTHVPIDYVSGGGPKIAIRVQELFGLDRHPTIAGGKVPLAIELLSPARRPVQTPRDLPGFWRGSAGAIPNIRGRKIRPQPHRPGERSEESDNRNHFRSFPRKWECIGSSLPIALAVRLPSAAK